jgi:signal transduction histidine kinase
MNSIQCLVSWDPKFLVFTDKAPQLLYYSHIPTALIFLLLSIFVFFKSKCSFISKILLAIAVLFSAWSFLDLYLWTNSNSGLMQFFWPMTNLTGLLISALTIYFVYAFLEGKDIRLVYKIVFFILFAPFLILLPTSLSSRGFDLSNCESIQGNSIYYFYFLEILFSAWLLIYLLKKYIQSEKNKRKEIFYVGMGSILFLVSFSGANVISSALTNYFGSDVSGTYWKILQYGLFGVPLFMALLAYLIVKYKAFNIKLIGTQALVAALLIGIGSQFFFIQNPTNIVLNGITLALVLGFGYMLVKSVKLEVKRKEELQALSSQLSDANAKLRQLDKAKSEFISIASHQLRTPLTSIKGFGSLLLEGTYGEVPEAQRGALEKIYISNERLIQLVEDLLNISRIEAGRMEFDFQEAQIEDLVQEAVMTLELSAKAKSLYLHWEKPATLMPKLKIDITKIKEVISNMIDNAIKYTQKGGITVKLETNTAWDTEHKDHKESVRMIVSDTGIGMDEEEVGMIFEKFQRGKQVAHYHTDGTGLGMYIGKKIVSEHKGKIWAESDGKGKGSRFILELPVS